MAKKNESPKLEDVVADIETVANFGQVLNKWSWAQYRSITAKHDADVAYAVAYEEAMNMTANGKPLSEKAKDNHAFAQTAELALAAQLADLQAKVYYNLMLKWRDSDASSSAAELIAALKDVR